MIHIAVFRKIAKYSIFILQKGKTSADLCYIMLYSEIKAIKRKEKMKKHLFKVAMLSLAIVATFVCSFYAEAVASDKTKKAASSDIIKVVSPERSSEIDLDNETIKKYFAEYTRECSYDYFGKGDQYFMNDVKLEWQSESGVEAEYYQVYLSQDKFFDEAEKYLTIKPEYTLQDLIPNRDYYWKVKVSYKNGEQSTSKAYKFTTKGSVRTITADGVSNSRDLGGAKTADGKTIKYGMIYRSANLDSITEKGKKQLRMLGIKTELDLRGDTLTKSPLGDDVKFINIKGAYNVGHFKGIEFGYDANNEYIGYFCDELRACADESNYPMIFHCAIGRDRTGTLAAYLQMLCGVSVNDIYRDFELSHLSVAGALDNSRGMYAPFDAMINYINAQPGSSLSDKAEKYAIRMGVSAEDIAAIRSILLEG